MSTITSTAFAVRHIAEDIATIPNTPYGSSWQHEHRRVVSEPVASVSEEAKDRERARHDNAHVLRHK